MSKLISLYIPAALFVAGCVVLASWDEPLLYARTLMEGNELKSYVAFLALLVAATVFAPFTVMPLIPVASALFGPFVTALLSITGWTIGAVGAFLIARYLGRPIVVRIVDLSKVDALINSLSPRAKFFYIVLLRLALPVDIASYALGLTQSVALLEYTAATVIGVSWFSFAFAYLGSAFLEGNLLLLTSVGAASAFVFALSWLILRRSNQSRND